MPEATTATRLPARAHEWLDVGDGQRVYWETYGNPDGAPAVVLHNGPGRGADRSWAGLLDPAAYRIVLLDQRGSGRQAPGAEVWSRCSTAISHSSTSGAPTTDSTPSTTTTMSSLVACMASSDCQALVAMQRPDTRLTSIDRPMHPSVASRAGITSSRTCATCLSIELGCAWTRGGARVHDPPPPRSGWRPGGAAGPATILRAAGLHKGVQAAVGPRSPGRRTSVLADASRTHSAADDLVEPGLLR